MRGTQILMVEDDVDVAVMYRLKLESDGIPVHVATTGETALRLAPWVRWDLVVLDMGLPDMSGLDVLTALRGDARTAVLPVVVLSNRDDPDLIDKALELGAIDYVIKVRMSPGQLSHHVLRWVAAGRARPMDLAKRLKAHTITDEANGVRDE
jgi:DNA-binding response OmpR family regulator